MQDERRMVISGYVPFFNNASTVEQSIKSLLDQEPKIEEVVAVDDGSSDNGAMRLNRRGVRVVRLSENQGRGAARARGIAETRGEFVISVDATKMLRRNFLQVALQHMQDEKVAAVCGRNWQPESENSVTRWRGRHLFKMNTPFRLNPNAALNTNGVLLRRSAIAAVGGFDVSRRHSEDLDLGRRLQQAGWTIVFDPTLLVDELVSNSWAEVFERVWRYNVGMNDRFSFHSWWKFVRLAWGVMLRRDFLARDFVGALASLSFPFVLLVAWSGWGVSPRDDKHSS